MPGNDTTHQHHNGGGFDLLRRATQAMMSKGKKSGLEASSGRWDAAKSGDRRSHIATGEGAYDPAKTKGPAWLARLAAQSSSKQTASCSLWHRRQWLQGGSAPAPGFIMGRRGEGQRGERESQRAKKKPRGKTAVHHTTTPATLHANTPPSGLRRLLRVSLAAAVFWNAGGAGTRCHLLVNLFGGSQCLGVLVQTLQRLLGFRWLAATWSELASRVLLACFHFYSCLAESQSALTGTPIHTRTQFSVLLLGSRCSHSHTTGAASIFG
ncbi:uncharacterized protein BBA_00010 [Beauveria bassiana ARSEF 2860]|uniref:Uncharacterized protein n=1 Tax=Beauveria bassiana (strain ARSEF 2860) TaxID=655819 RepID=J4WKW2_BEAB2|nr:uncharacterized protein BBA_00010 [Beauveria bassiana ARSEF 2860]EJP70380.1 hypothetical protein BBA_00010 [Beauveria bassiana ARSEF 2860]